MLRLCCGCLKRWRRSVHTHAALLQKLVEVGRFEPKAVTHYQPGQFFLHRVFGYRGIVLFPWVARVYDRDVQGRDTNRTSWEESGVVYNHIEGLTAQSHHYYQALIDHRDFPHVRTQPEAITFIAEQNDMSLYSLPGLDYVSHEDVLPYTSTGPQEAFSHELFSQFFAANTDAEGLAFLPREMLHVWREKNQQWLELGDVHRESTEEVRVTVMPFYMGRREVQPGVKVYWWRYSIRVESLRRERLQLKERHWRIYSASGTLETVKGRGVVGQEPVFSPSQPAFQYSSHVSLQSPSGHMWGTFRFERQDGKLFNVRVPPFSLESQDDRPS